MGAFEVAGFVMGAGATLGIGAIAGNYAESGDMADLRRTRQNIVRAEGRAEEADRNMFRTEQKIGEGCVRALRIYLPGQRLAETEEDSLVSDIVAIPSTPCTDNPSEVRARKRDLFEADETKYGVATRLEQERQKLPGREQDARDNEIPNALVIAGISSIVGGAFGAAWGYDMEYYS